MNEPLRPSLLGPALAVLLAAATIRCGNDGGGATAVDAAPADASPDEAIPYQGPTSGGTIPLPPISETDATVDVTVEADNRCCNVTLSLPDPTGDEAMPLLRGTQYPLDAPGGIALTHQDGAWRASACLPVNVAIEYAFAFVVPFGTPPPDGGSSIVPPEGATPIPPETDAGTAEDAPAPAPIDAADDAPTSDPTDAVVEPPPTTMVELRYNPDLPTIPDGLGSLRNVFGPVSDCSTIGATTGTIPPAPVLIPHD